MRAWIASGGIAECILGLTVLEVMALAVLWHRRRQGIAPLALLPTILAGDFLLAAWRLARLHWALAAAALLCAGLAHAVDLTLRWRRRPDDALHRVAGATVKASG